MLSENIKSKLLKEFKVLKGFKNPRVSKEIDAVVVLTGDSTDPLTEDGSFDTQKRLKTGLRIYRRIEKLGGRPTLILTGTKPQNEIMLEIVKKNKIDRVIKLPNIPRPPLASTLIQIKQLKKLKNKNMMIVTHAVHGPRTYRYVLKHLSSKSKFALFLIDREAMKTSQIKSETERIYAYSKKGDLDLYVKGKTIAIIQARMSSTRLPGKVLMKIKGKPMLWYVVSRMKKANLIDEIIVATSKSRLDGAIVNFCEVNRIKCFRGSLQNVLARYYKCAKENNADIVVRITSDCPLIDGKLIDEGIVRFKSTRPDYLSNTIERTFPRGFDFEIFTFAALERAFLNAKDKIEKEHVTPYIWKRPRLFRLKQFNLDSDKSFYRLTVDTEEDYQVVKLMIGKYNADQKSCLAISRILDAHPRISMINRDVEQKALEK